MRSSAAIAGRAFIMLACVIAIPTLALWGTSWTDVVKRLQDFHWPQSLDFVSASTSAPPDNPPHDTSTNALAATTTPSAAGPLALAGSQSPHGPLSMPAASQAQPVAQSAVVPVEYQASAESSSVPAPVADAAGLGATGTLWRPTSSTLSKRVCVNWERRIICWSRGATSRKCTASTAKWRWAAAPSTRVASRPPMPTRSSRWSRCCGRWRRGVTAAAQRWKTENELFLRKLVARRSVSVPFRPGLKSGLVKGPVCRIGWVP